LRQQEIQSVGFDEIRGFPPEGRTRPAGSATTPLDGRMRRPARGGDLSPSRQPSDGGVSIVLPPLLGV